MARVTPEQVIEMQKLYAQVKSYAEVGRQFGFSAATVSKHLKEAPPLVEVSDTFEPPMPISLFNFGTLSEEEMNSLKEWKKEYGIF